MENTNETKDNLLAESSGYKEIDSEQQKQQQRKEEVSQNYNTLQEDIFQSVAREFIFIWHKLQFVILPRFQACPTKNLKNWDLWGPLFFTILLSMYLIINISLVSIKTASNLASTIVVVFGVVWIGGLIVTLNAKFLGAKMTFFQTQCVIGYCLFPLILGATVIVLTPSILSVLVKLIICCVAFVWSSFSSVAFMGDIVKNKKKGLALYPVYLFYFACSGFLSSI